MSAASDTDKASLTSSSGPPAVTSSDPVTVEYYDLADGDARIVDFMDGIPLIVAGMKTLLETGSPIGSRS